MNPTISVQLPAGSVNESVTTPTNQGHGLSVASGGQLPQGVGTVAITCQDGAGAAQPCSPSQAGWLATVIVTVNWIDLRGNRTTTLMTRVARP